MKHDSRFENSRLSLEFGNREKKTPHTFKFTSELMHAGFADENPLGIEPAYSCLIFESRRSFNGERRPSKRMDEKWNKIERGTGKICTLNKNSNIDCESSSLRGSGSGLLNHRSTDLNLGRFFLPSYEATSSYSSVHLAESQ